MVEWKELWEVCSFNRGRTITAKNAIKGEIPVIAGGQTPSYFHNESNRDGESITVAGSGAYAGFVSYWNQPIFVSDAFTVDPTEKLIHKYLFYWLKKNQKMVFATQKGAGVPHVHGKDIANFQIPIPSKPEQERIVKILDTFTDSIANLKAQIDARRKQYEYYRDQLLDLEGKEGVEMKTLGEICEFIRGPFGGALKKEMFVKNGYAIYEQQHAIYGDWVFRYFIDDFKFHQMKRFEVKAGDILMSCSGTMGKTSIVPDNATKGIINQALLKLSVKEMAINKYIKMYMDSIWFQKSLSKNTSGGAIQNVASVSILKELQIPIPSKEEQSRIVGILDQFEAIIANLEAQLKAREKQYEYYRNKLLTFE